MRWNEPGAPALPKLGLDRDRFRALYFESLPHVYGYLLHRVAGNQSLAEDLTQETYLAAIGQARHGQTSISAPWLIGVARHKLVDHFRRLSREERKLALVANETCHDENRWSDMAVDQVLASLHALPALQRAAVGLRYLDDLPVSEVARLLDRSVHATESLLARGRDGLRRHLVEHAHE